MHIALSQQLVSMVGKSALIVAIALVANHLLRSLIKVPSRLDTRRGRTFLALAHNAVTMFIGALTIYTIFSIWDINIAPLLASAGIIGIVIGIGSRSLFEDLIAGIFLIPEAKIAVGDYIELGGGLSGTVESMGLKNLTLISDNGAYTVVPNGQIKQVTNYSYGKAHAVINVTVRTDQNIDDVLKAFRSVIASYDKEEKMSIHKGSKVLGVNKIDHAFIVGALLITDGNLRGKIEPDFNHRLIKEFDKRKLEFA